MTEINEKILTMIKRNASVNEICTETKLSNKQLFYRLNMLKIKGFNFSRKYYYDGEICYELNKELNTQKKEINLITSPKDQEFKVIFLSDLHLCNEKQRLDLLNEVYEFCIKEGIHIIINAGDLIDGLSCYSPAQFNSFEKQIEYALRVHPFDKNILNFICLGNHDYKSLEKSGQNLETAILNKRHDIVPLGYGLGILNVKNDRIIVQHPKTPTSQKKEVWNDGLFINGHSHESKNICSGNRVNIYLPSLSDVPNYTNKNLPGFTNATISFNNGIFWLGKFEQYIFLDKLYKVNESTYELFRGKNASEKSIRNEEDRKNDDKIKKLTN